MPASVIVRIEQVELANLQCSDAGLLMTYQERLIPILELIPVDALVGAAATVIVVSVGAITAGFIVENIIDIVDDHVDIDLFNVAPGSIGSCRIANDVIDLIDLQYHLETLQSSYPVRNDKAIGKVLVLGGDPRSMDLLAPLIKAAGYIVSSARSFEAALSVAETGGAIDVVLIDMAMAESKRHELRGLAGLLGNAPFIGLTDGQLTRTGPSPAELCMLADRLDRRRLLEIIG